MAKAVWEFYPLLHPQRAATSSSLLRCGPHCYKFQKTLGIAEDTCCEQHGSNQNHCFTGNLLHLFLLGYLSQAAHHSHDFMVPACFVSKSINTSKYKWLQNTTCPDSLVERKVPSFADNTWRSVGGSLGSWWRTCFLH